MPEQPEDDLGYLSTMDNEPEPEESAPEPEVPEQEVEGEEEAESQAEPEGDGEEEPEREPVAASKTGVEVEVQPRRSQTRIQKLANERAQEREARIRAEAERDALLKFRPSTPTHDAEAARKREEKLSLMEPLERAVFIQNEALETLKNNQILTELRSEDRADKAAFDARAVVDPRYARNKDDVEKELRDLRARGVNATREQVLAQVIGRKLLAEKPRKGVREAAARRVASTSGKPVSARTTASTPVGKGDSLGDIEARLRGKSFNEMFNN